MRKILEIIVHCTATFADQRVTVADIARWHKQRGWKTIGYHYVVDQDGNVFPGRPLEQAGAHCLDHNKNSIGVVYCGGLNAETPAPMRKKPRCLGCLQTSSSASRRLLFTATVILQRKHVRVLMPPLNTLPYENYLQSHYAYRCGTAFGLPHDPTHGVGGRCGAGPAVLTSGTDYHPKAG